MAPRLRVLAGSSLETLVPITSLVNTSKPHTISSDLFEGQIVAHIKGFTDERGVVRDSEYFRREDRQGVTWSIQVQGRFLEHYTADDVLFGNTFDRPLTLPWGASAVLKFMHYIDPTLEHDLQSPTKPWALSPLIATMPHFTYTRVSPSGRPSRPLSPSTPTTARPWTKHTDPPPFPSLYSLEDSTSQLHLALIDSSSSDSSVSTNSDVSASSFSSRRSSRSNRSGAGKRSGTEKIKQAVQKVAQRKSKPRRDPLKFENASQRRSYFTDPTNRRTVRFGPHDLITTDFCYGFLNFSPSLSLQLPGGLSFDLMRYWNGQPVRFMCCERKQASGVGNEEPWGRIFWCVTIELADDEEDADNDGERLTG
jgi:hypothetical protein